MSVNIFESHTNNIVIFPPHVVSSVLLPARFQFVQLETLG